MAGERRKQIVRVPCTECGRNVPLELTVESHQCRDCSTASVQDCQKLDDFSCLNDDDICLSCALAYKNKLVEDTCLTVEQVLEMT